jgi:maltose phosphorylase
MATKDQQVARNLLTYHNQLIKQLKMHKQSRFQNGRSLSNGHHEWEECHNEWEITHEEIHRNGAIALLFLTIIALPVITSYIPEKDQKF